MSTDKPGKVPPHWFTGSTFRKRLDSPPPAPAVGVEFGAQSRQGRTRATNDDHYLILCLGRSQETLLTSLPDRSARQRFDEYGYGMVIADGTGRHGEAASRLAITTLLELIVSYGRWNLRIDDPIANEVMDRADRFYRGIDSTLIQASRESLPGLQSTLTAVFVAGTELFFAHTGDSRAYLGRDGELLQLTKDHPLTHGRLGAPNGTAAGPDRDGRLSQTIAGVNAAGPIVDVEHCGLHDGDSVLLCTNGLTDVIDEARIATVLKMQITPEDQCRILVELAVQAGADDDVTALIGRYRLADDPTRS
jgi:PPM family protein phosphatase